MGKLTTTGEAAEAGKCFPKAREDAASQQDEKRRMRRVQGGKLERIRREKQRLRRRHPKVLPNLSVEKHEPRKEKTSDKKIGNVTYVNYL